MKNISSVPIHFTFFPSEVRFYLIFVSLFDIWEFIVSSQRTTRPLSTMMGVRPQEGAGRQYAFMSAANIAAAKTVGEDCLQSAAVSTQWTTPGATRHKSCAITLRLKRPSSPRCCLLVYLNVFKLREAPLPTLLFYSNTHHFLFFHTGEGLLMPLIQPFTADASSKFRGVCIWVTWPFFSEESASSLCQFSLTSSTKCSEIQFRFILAYCIFLTMWLNSFHKNLSAARFSSIFREEWL